jgi:hypothetical protein
MIYLSIISRRFVQFMPLPAFIVGRQPRVRLCSLRRGTRSSVVIWRFFDHLGSFSNKTISFWILQARMMIKGGPQALSPFLADSRKATQGGTVSMQRDEEGEHLESLYHSMIKQQEWLAGEIRRIRSRLDEKVTSKSAIFPSAREELLESKEFRDDTALAIGSDKGILSRGMSEPEAQSVGPLVEREVSRGSLHQKVSKREKREGERKRKVPVLEDDRSSLCMPADYCSPNREEVTTNDSVDLPEVRQHTKKLQRCKGDGPNSYPTSGKSSFENLTSHARRCGSESCPDFNQMHGSFSMPYSPDVCPLEYSNSLGRMSPRMHPHMSGPMPSSAPYGRVMMTPQVVMMAPQMQYALPPHYHYMQHFQRPGPMAHQPMPSQQMPFPPSFQAQQQIVDLREKLKEAARLQLAHQSKQDQSDATPKDKQIETTLSPNKVQIQSLSAEKPEVDADTASVKQDQANEGIANDLNPLTEIQDFNLTPEELDTLFEDFELPSLGI